MSIFFKTFIVSLGLLGSLVHAAEPMGTTYTLLCNLKPTKFHPINFRLAGEYDLVSEKEETLANVTP